MQSLVQLVKSSFSNQTLRQGAILMAANSAGNALQYGFHAYVSRSLGPEEYGVFAALLALFVIVGVPSTIAQTVVTQYIARFRALNEMSKVKGILTDALKYLTLASFVVFALVALLSAPIAGFLNVASQTPVVAMASVFLVVGASTAVAGTLQGLQRFYVMAANGFLGPILRLVAGIALISIGWGASGALGASTISTLLMVAISLFFVRAVWSQPYERHGLSWGTISQFSSVVLVGTLAFTVLTNIDLIVVKHYFSPEEAGYYSAASVLGKIILFFPTAVAAVMFPKTSHRFALGQDASDIARQAVLATAALCGMAAIALALVPALAVHILFGSMYEASIPLVGVYGATMGLYALIQLLTTYYISQEQSRFVWLLAIVTAVLSIWLILVHVTLIEVILSLAVSALVVLVISEVWLGGLGLFPRFKSVTR